MRSSALFFLTVMAVAAMPGREEVSKEFARTVALAAVFVDVYNKNQ